MVKIVPVVKSFHIVLQSLKKVSAILLIIHHKMNAFDTLDNRCRVCALELSDLTCSIPILGDSSSSFFLQSKISKYLYVSVSYGDNFARLSIFRGLKTLSGDECDSQVKLLA